jgi:hypothetical protein
MRFKKVGCGNQVFDDAPPAYLTWSRVAQSGIEKLTDEEFARLVAQEIERRNGGTNQ